jgi:hypothetical protein
MSTTQTKLCKKCLIEKPISDFGVDRRRTKIYIQSWCKICSNIASLASARKRYAQENVGRREAQREKEARRRLEKNQVLEKPCATCKQVLPRKEFLLCTSSSGYKFLGNICRICRNASRKAWIKTKKDGLRHIQLKRDYGITLDEYNAMMNEQNGACVICLKEPVKRHLDVDHCHVTGQVRGLLCSKCNLALGLLNDSPNLFQSAADYLTYYQNIDQPI